MFLETLGTLESHVNGKVKAEMDMHPLSTPLPILMGEPGKPDPGSPGTPLLEGRQASLLSVLKVEVLGPRSWGRGGGE